MKPMFLMAVLAVTAVPALAWANADKLAMILQQQREIRSETESSTGAYARFGAPALGRIETAQDRIFSLLNGVNTLDQLNADQKVELFNALEEVKAVIAQNESNRQKCWRERKLGTSVKQTRCATMAELEQIRLDAQQWKGEPTICGQRDAVNDCGGNSRRELGM